MKVLHLLNSKQFSGAENVVCQIINMMRNEKNMDMLYCSPDGPIREVLEERNIPYFPISSLTVREVRRVIKAYAPDVIHAHDFTAGVISAVAAGRIPVINHLHNNAPWLQTICPKSIIYGLCSMRFWKILTVSDSVMDEYVFGKLQKGKTMIVGNPINLREIREKAQEGTWDTPCEVAFLGRLTEAKNPQMFVEIMHELSKKMPSVRAVMIGEGELRGEVERKIQTLNMESGITMCGFQKNPYPILNRAKVLCMPSVWEGFGMAAVEMLTLGKPVVAAPVGGLAHIVNDACGKLCRDCADYVDELYRLLSEDAVYQKKCQGALDRAQDFDNTEQYKQLLCRVYRTVKA